MSVVYSIIAHRFYSLNSSNILVLCCSDFAESPSSVTIEVENGVEREAVFRCRHQRIDAVISWQMNGSSSRLYPDIMDGFIRDINGARVDTLTIPAIPEYNGTEIVCVANFFDGSPLLEVTPPADNIIIGIQACTIRVLLKF